MFFHMHFLSLFVFSFNGSNAFSIVFLLYVNTAASCMASSHGNFVI